MSIQRIATVTGSVIAGAALSIAAYCPQYDSQLT